VTEEELYQFSQRLLSRGKRDCPACRGRGKIKARSHTASVIPRTRRCKACGGNGKMVDVYDNFMGYAA
jgi:DnaJ-class molecular chaperone